MSAPKDDLLEHQQRKVFSLIGRCLLNLQIFEQSLKVILPRVEVSIQDTSIIASEDLTKSMLGSLVGKLTSTVLSTEQNERARPKRDEQDQTGNVRFTSAFKRIYSEADHEKVSSGLTDLVERRNFLVHHFQSTYNLKSHESCLQALVYLDDLNSLIKSQIGELKALTTEMDAGKKLLSEFLLSPIAERLFEPSFRPESVSEWAMIGEVQSLQEAEKIFNKDGWTPLDKAIQHLNACDIETAAPTHYECKSWPDLLHKSKLFQIERRKNTESNRWEHWYRSSQSAPKQTP